MENKYISNIPMLTNIQPVNMKDANSGVYTNEKYLKNLDLRNRRGKQIDTIGIRRGAALISMMVSFVI
jgi:hypothetical protein